MDLLRKLNPPIYDTIYQEHDQQLRDALALLYAWLELIDHIETAADIHLAAKLELFEYFFLFLDEGTLDYSEHCPMLQQIALLYANVTDRYRGIIEEVIALTGLRSCVRLTTRADSPASALCDFSVPPLKNQP
jgi:hypothetical protein